MKVKDLRQKLVEFGQKNKDHYDRFQKKGVTQKGDVSSSKTAMQVKTTNEEVDHLDIETKPSSTSTTPSTTCESDVSPSSVSTDNIVLMPFLNKMPPSYSFDSSEGSESSGWADVKPPPTSEDENLEHVMGKEHLDLLEKQAPIVLTSKSFVNVETVDSFDEDPFAEELTGSMHNSTLLQGALLTKSTLDALCDTTIQEEVDEESDEPALKLCSSSTGASIHTAELSLSEDIDSMRSMKTVSSKDSDTASISTNAMTSKMGNLFLKDPEEQEPMPQPVVARRKTIHPEDLPFLKASSQSSEDSPQELKVVRRKTINPEDLGFLKSNAPASDPDKALNEITPKPRNTVVSRAIRKFGGPRKNLVERRKEQLNNKISEHNSVTIVKKLKWDKDERTGAYKQVTVYEKEVKRDDCFV